MRYLETHHPFHLPHLKNFLRKDNLSPLFVSASIRQLAIGMVGIFAPLFVFQMAEKHFPGIALEGKIIFVIAFYFLYYLCVVLLTYPGAMILKKMSLARSMFWGNLFIVLELLFFLLVEYDLRMLVPAILFGALHVPFYWIPYHLIFVSKTGEKGEGKEFSKLNILRKLSSAIGPFIGGTIITLLGFPVLFTVALIIVLVSAFPILQLKIERQTNLLALGEILGDIFSRKYWKEVVALMAAGVESSTQLVLWPIFVFVVLGSVEVLGTITSLVLISSLVVLYFAGDAVDKKKKGQVLLAGSSTNSVVWILRIFANTFSKVFIFDFLHRVTFSFLWVPFEVLFYDNTRLNGKVNHVIFRELTLNSGRLVLLLVLLGLILLGINWTFVFAFTALGSLSTYLMAKASR